jgi:hypothetical protein
MQEKVFERNNGRGDRAHGYKIMAGWSQEVALLRTFILTRRELPKLEHFVVEKPIPHRIMKIPGRHPECLPG